MKLCHKKMNTNSHNNKILEEGSQCICLSYILIDSVYRGKIILKLFQKNVNMLLKKKRRLSLLLTTQKFLMTILIEKTLMKKVLIKKVKYSKHLKLELESSISRNMANLCFLNFPSSLLKHNENYFWKNIRGS